VDYGGEESVTQVDYEEESLPFDEDIPLVEDEEEDEEGIISDEEFEDVEAVISGEWRDVGNYDNKRWGWHAGRGSRLLETIPESKSVRFESLF
jgi:hypothetical protein